MESVESPLDVLSRAATMVQDSLPNGNSSPDESTKQTSTKQLPTTKWKRERRRLPEYSRKSDPKLSENMFPELSHSPGSPTERTAFPSNGIANGGNSSSSSNGEPDSPKSKNGSRQDAPIDMSVRQRGLPPSYSQAISSPSYRPSVITQAPTPVTPPAGVWNDLPSGISMCDPIIDEHFRRSLGKDYLMLFNNNKTPAPTESPVPKTTPNNRVLSTSPTSSSPTVRELLDIDTAGLSVDDHFAKALGDTWLKLNNKKDGELSQTNGASEKTTVVSL